MKHTNPQTLSSVSNALRILKSFTIQKPEHRLTEIARDLGISKSTASRLLSTLLNEGFVYQDPITNKYRLGQRIVSLYNVILTSYSDLAEAASPLIERLAHDTSEALRVAVLEENEVAYIYQTDPAKHEEITTYVGGRAPVHCTASGKMLLAFQDEFNLSKILSRPLTKHTPATVTDPGELKERIGRIRELGYCVSNGEYHDNIVSISAPLRDANGLVISVLTLVALKHRMDEQRITTYVNKVVKTAKEISRQFGYLM
ncbi:IclR family transcriptional regulator [Paenibacillus sp. LHD-117]|uniref:IclR family transcriptional regulator n=1 Tax=Paenibacillus sp. LHD-117 TaxID=3071412 RepID=UPI0027E17BF5|nr:IclR family transcriptional regulator [Paenibacillus sp. LHD-117]MDQ6421633.1 IclR family transcriptional regulator [Paenibacillus sp. LHD-117]